MRFIALFILVLFLIPVVILAFSDNPPNGRACNPPGFQSCYNGCHDDFAVNSGDGSLTILGVPPSYNPGTTYPITVRIADPGMVRWGFELTTMDTLDCQAGGLIVTDPDSTRLSNNTGCSPDYIKQTDLGSHTGVLDGPVFWRFDWQAPASGTGAVTFYSSGVAANDGGGANGDYVYCTSLSTDEMLLIHDGGVTSLQAPDTVCSDSTTTLCVTVENFGNAPDSFIVISTVDGFEDTSVIPNLNPGDTTTVCFNWTPSTPGNYTFNSCTEVEGDTNSANNCGSRPIVAIVCGVGVEEEEDELRSDPELDSGDDLRFELLQNCPNPFNSTTTIRYSLPVGSGQEAVGRKVSLKIYDLTGRVVRTLMDKEEEAGVYDIVWDGRDTAGKKVSNGFYFIRLNAYSDKGINNSTRKLVILR